LTPLGKHLRKLRAERGIYQKDMAAAIGVSAAYLSALEHGHRGKPSWDLLQRMMGFFNVIWDEAEVLQSKWELSDPRVVIDTTGATAQATEVANLLARKINGLNGADLAKIRNILSKAKN